MDTVSMLFEQFGFYALMLILLVVMVITAMPKKKAVPSGMEAAALEAAGTAGAVHGEPQVDLPDINLQEQSELKKQIEKFVQQNPDAVAQLLRNWIAEDWD